MKRIALDWSRLLGFDRAPRPQTRPDVEPAPRSARRPVMVGGKPQAGPPLRPMVGQKPID